MNRITLLTVFIIVLVFAGGCRKEILKPTKVVQSPVYLCPMSSLKQAAPLPPAVVCKRQAKNDLERLGFQGPIHEITSVSSFPESIEPDEVVTRLTFNPKGFFNEEESSSKNAGRQKLITRYSYNNALHRARLVRGFHITDGNFVSWRVHVISYDGNGKAVLMNTYCGQVCNIADPPPENPREAKPKKDLISLKAYRYNRDNSLIETLEQYRGNSGRDPYTFITWNFKYDETGRKLKVGTSDSHGGGDTYTISLNESLLIREIFINSRNERYLLKYTFDSHQNWTRQEIFRVSQAENGAPLKKPFGIIRRKISYY